MINEAMARDFFPGEDPIGKRVTIAMKEQNVPSEIIGVVRDVRHVGLETPARAMTYWPYPELVYSGMTLVVRTESEALSLSEAIRREVLALDQDQPIADVSTMEQLLADSTSRARFSTMLLGVFAAVALLLAAVGIFGVMSYGVSNAPTRSGENGVGRAGWTYARCGEANGADPDRNSDRLRAAFGLTRVMISLFTGSARLTDDLVAISALLARCVAGLLSAGPASNQGRSDDRAAIRVMMRDRTDRTHMK
jgi:putative ABC transport system permease protein